MAPTKRDGSKPRLFIFSIVVDARLEELLIITILLPVIANFSTIRQNKHKQYHIGNNYGLNYKQLTQNPNRRDENIAKSLVAQLISISWFSNKVI